MERTVTVNFNEQEELHLAKLGVGWLATAGADAVKVALNGAWTTYEESFASQKKEDIYTRYDKLPTEEQAKVDALLAQVELDEVK